MPIPATPSGPPRTSAIGRSFISIARRPRRWPPWRRAGPEAAIEELDAGLAKLREVIAARESPEQAEDEELVKQILDLKESLRTEYHLGPSLAEQLSEAVAAEEYERAARLRDEIARRKHKPKA